MNRRAGSAAVLLILLGGGATGVGCNFIVGVGDYSIVDGSAGDDGTVASDDGQAGPDVTAADADAGAIALDARGDHPEAASADAADAARRDADADAGVDAAADDADAAKRPRDTGAPDLGVDMDGGDASPPDANPDTGAGSGDASDGAVAPPADGGLTCGQGIPTTQAFMNLVQACVFATSCDPYVLPVTLSDCIGGNALRSGGAAGPLSCLATITDCAGYYGCEGTRLATLDANECAGFDSKCVGNVAFDCSGGATGGVPFPGTVTNCALIPGATCLVHEDDVGNSRADCVVLPTCTPNGGVAQCSGNNLYTCESLDGGTTSGVGLGRSCGTGQCVPGTGGAAATCTFVGSGVCSSPTGGTCVGTTLQESCTTPNATFDFDCAASGGTCATDTANDIACVSPGCPVNSTCTDSCNAGDSTLTTCVGGAPFTIDCTQYGQFMTCSPTDTQNTLTFCTPN